MSGFGTMDSPPRDARDNVIEILADGEAAALERGRDLEAERNTYREILSVALDRLRAQTALSERQHNTIRQLLELNRVQRRAEHE